MRRLLQVAIVCLCLSLSGGALAVDLATAFGVGGYAAALKSAPGLSCLFQATHAGTTSETAVTITANSIDSATVNLICNGVAFTTAIPTISVNGHQVNSVSFPQTVTASAPGTWYVSIGPLITFTIIAQ